MGALTIDTFWGALGPSNALLHSTSLERGFAADGSGSGRTGSGRASRV